jgi:hypothetical protein
MKVEEIPLHEVGTYFVAAKVGNVFFENISYRELKTSSSVRGSLKFGIIHIVA